MEMFRSAFVTKHRQRMNKESLLFMPDLKMAVAVLTMVNLGLVGQTHFQPAVKDYEEISACDFIDFEFGEPFLSVVPIVWKDGIGITPTDRLKR